MIRADFYTKVNNMRSATLIIAVLSLLVSLFFQFPNLTFLKQQYTGEAEYMWYVVEQLAEEPFLKRDFPDGSHEEKKVFRLTLPVIGYIFGIKTLGFYLLQAFFGFLTFWFSAILIKRITGDIAIAAAFTLGLSCIYFGCSAFIDVFGFTDSTAYFFLMLALISRNPLLILSSVFLASWSDERGLIASAFVFLWFSLADQVTYKKISNVIRFNTPTLAVVAAWVLYFITRFAYSSLLDLETKTGGIDEAFVGSIAKIQLSLWSGYEAFWLLLFFFAIVAISKKDYWLLAAMVGGYLVITTVALNVFDTTKSMAYGTIGFFIVARYLQQHVTLGDMRKYISSIALICILCPTIFIINTIMHTSPFYQEAFQFLVNRLRQM